MKNLIEKFGNLPRKYRICIYIVLIILAFSIFPAWLVFGAGALLSYKLVKSEGWKYLGAIGLGSLALIISIASTVSSPSTDSQTVSVAPVVNQEKKTEETIASTTEKTDVAVKTIAPATTPNSSQKDLYTVVKVVDGDTLDVSINGKTERLRLIGINTPETVDPRKPVECFGTEASNKAKALLSGQKVSLEADATQGERDKYDRLLRYVFLENGTNFNLLMIQQGYAYEYTYNTSYKYQSGFKQAQKEASQNKVGLWADSACQAKATTSTIPAPTTQTNTGSCSIKGNISSTGEKIYHVEGCGSYAKTTIDESKGEQWFCSEQEAENAGWRKALNCK